MSIQTRRKGIISLKRKKTSVIDTGIANNSYYVTRKWLGLAVSVNVCKVEFDISMVARPQATDISVKEIETLTILFIRILLNPIVN